MGIANDRWGNKGDWKVIERWLKGNWVVLSCIYKANWVETECDKNQVVVVEYCQVPTWVGVDLGYVRCCIYAMADWNRHPYGNPSWRKVTRQAERDRASLILAAVRDVSGKPNWAGEEKLVVLQQHVLAKQRVKHTQEWGICSRQHNHVNITTLFGLNMAINI